METQEEIWKDALGYEGLYQVSSFGNVRSIDRHKIDTRNRVRNFPSKLLNRFKNYAGYLHVSLYDKNARYKKWRVNRLVADAFLPNPANKPQVNHKNGIKDDNRVSNLEWATSSENVIHAVANGLMVGVRGEKNNLTKLKSAEVLKIRRSSGSQKYLAKKYGVSISLISMIKNRKVWTHI